MFFDLDGTLTDPFPGITRSIQHALAQLGHPVPDAAELHWCIGPPLLDTFGRLLDSADRALLDRAIAHYRDRFSTVGLFENAVYPEVPGAVEALRASGYRTFVVTSKPRVFALRIVEHFGLARLFDRVYGSELDGTRTDKGELIAHVLASETLAAERVVMVGDRQHDMIGARKCAVASIGVTYGYGTAAELEAHGAIRLAASPAEIVHHVHAHFGSSGT
ncbi:MAG TPA: HAD family hydrolase [Candidatus Limnocylindrales bacterium]|nr:HAD family hydrolase [Candidatus Limnocylindrales bacterium]